MPTASESPAIPATDLILDLDVVVEAPPPPDLDLEDLRNLVDFALRREGATGTWSVAVVLTDDARLRALHRDFMGLDAPTDVMTFPLDGTDPGAEATQGGDVVVSVERAAEQAVEFGQAPAAEVRFLVVHGLLHLCGWDDTTDADRSRMLSRQAELLDDFHRTGVVRDRAVAEVERCGPRAVGEAVPARSDSRQRAPEHVGRVEGGASLDLAEGGAQREPLA